MSRLSQHANARGAQSSSRSQPLPSTAPNAPSTRDRACYHGLGSQGSETQDYHASLARSRPSSGHSYYSSRTTRTPPASMSFNENAKFSPSVRDFERVGHSDIHNLRSGTFSFGRPTLRPTSQPGTGASPIHVGAAASPLRHSRIVSEAEILPSVAQANQTRPPTPLEPQATHIRAWLHRLETGVNSIRNEFEAFRESTDADKETQLVLKDTMSSTLEACRQIPHVLKTQNDDHAKSLASGLSTLMRQHQSQVDVTRSSKNLGTIEHRLADLERRMSTSHSMISSKIEELTAALKAQMKASHESSTVAASLEDRLRYMLEADQNNREAACSALHQCLDNRDSTKVSDTSDIPVSHEMSVTKPDHVPSNSTNKDIRPGTKDSEGDVLSISSWSSNERTPVKATEIEPFRFATAAPAPWFTYGKNNRHKLGETKTSDELRALTSETKAQKRNRRKPKPRGWDNRKRKRAPRTKKAAESSGVPGCSIDTMSALEIPVPESRPRRPDSRRKFAASSDTIWPIPTRFPPARHAKKHDVVYVAPK